MPTNPRARPSFPTRLAAVVLLLAAAACRGGGDAPPARADSAAAGAGSEAFRPVSVGDTAPAYAARTFAGDEARVGGAGAPVTLLNVWATWCTSCREEMGDLAALHREYGPRGLRVLAVSVDDGPEARVRRFAEREGLPFAVAHDPEGAVQRLYGVVGVPETYLVGGDGRVLWKRAGNVHGALPEARGAIASALGGGAR
jgi:peroxiredoxin